MESYLQLNPMEEEKAIKFATLHLNGKVHDWWFHGMTTLGHEHVTSYIDFTHRLMTNFTRRIQNFISRSSRKLYKEGQQKHSLRSFRE
jgi:hypothetical protein